MPTIDEERELMAVIDDLVACVKGRRASLVSESPRDGVREYAAAGLMRGCDLLEAGSVVVRAGHTEGVGLLARAAWESWLVGAFLLYGGQAAFLRLEAEHQRQERNVANRTGVQMTDVLDAKRATLEAAERNRRRAQGQVLQDTDPITFDRLNVETMAQELGPLMEAATGESANVVAAYDMFYRSHSGYDTHGMGTLNRYIDSSREETLALREDPLPWLPPDRALACAAMYLSLLAEWIFERFGILAECMDGAQKRLVERMRGAAEEVMAQAPTSVIDRLPSPTLASPRAMRPQIREGS